MSELFITVGFPRSGKSTFVEKLRRERKIVVVGGDQCRDVLFGGVYTKEGNTVILGIMESMVRLLLAQDQDVIIDGIHLTRFEREWWARVGKEHDSKVTFLWINTPLEICLTRNKESCKLPSETLIKMGEKFEPIQEDEGYDKIVEITGE